MRTSRLCFKRNHPQWDGPCHNNSKLVRSSSKQAAGGCAERRRRISLTYEGALLQRAHWRLLPSPKTVFLPSRSCWQWSFQNSAPALKSTKARHLAPAPRPEWPLCMRPISESAENRRNASNYRFRHDVKIDMFSRNENASCVSLLVAQASSPALRSLHKTHQARRRKEDAVSLHSYVNSHLSNN